MNRREFIGLSAMASAVLIAGGIPGFNVSHSARNEVDFPEYKNRIRMRGGCRDFRVMTDSVPGFMEREIFDGWS